MFHALAQTYDNYTYTYTTASGTQINDPAVVLGFLIMFAVGLLVFGIPTIIGLWRMFTKAGLPGWAAIVPIYSTLIWLKMVRRPSWWILLLLFVPFANVIVSIILVHDTSKAFGKDVGMTLVLLFFPFIGYPILGFGSAKYQYADPAPSHEDHDVPNQPVAPTPPSAPVVQ